MTKMVSATNRPNVFILSDSSETNPYKKRNKKSRWTICLIVIFTFAAGLMMGHESSGASPYVDNMLKKVNGYGESINSNNEVVTFEKEESVDFTSEEYMKNRYENFNSLFKTWFEGNSTNKLVENADEKGPIIDFAVVGYASSTNSVVSNLASIAAMPVGDTCTPPSQTVFYAYKLWPEKWGEEKLLKGTSCGATMGSGNASPLKNWSVLLPRTKLIIGIAHPVNWFKSLWDQVSRTAQIDKMTANKDPYGLTNLCVGNNCRNSCQAAQLFCVHRARFHVGLAKMGKTPLSDSERELLAAMDEDGGSNIVSDEIQNDIFLYDETELTSDYAWEELADFLGVGEIPHKIDHLIRIQKRADINNVVTLDFCEEKYNNLRAMLMSYSYELGEWLEKYFLPVANDVSRPDVRMAHPKEFENVIKSYKSDPCGTLVRDKHGNFVLK